MVAMAKDLENPFIYISIGSEPKLSRPLTFEKLWGTVLNVCITLILMVFLYLLGWNPQRNSSHVDHLMALHTGEAKMKT